MFKSLVFGQGINAVLPRKFGQERLRNAIHEDISLAAGFRNIISDQACAFKRLIPFGKGSEHDGLSSLA